METYEDPIVSEVHETRAKLLAKYGGLEGYAQHLREIEADMSDRIVTREPRRPIKGERKIS